ncbi:MAG TPA: hypothetical protein VIM42_09010 [Clostridium sp.]
MNIDNPMYRPIGAGIVFFDSELQMEIHETYTGNMFSNDGVNFKLN